MKPRLYLETSVVSYYVGRPSRDLIIAGRQQITRDWWETDPSAAWPSSMCRFALDRHNRAINMSFMDSSIRRVRLYDLWTLKWHRAARPNYEVEIPWLPR